VRNSATRLKIETAGTERCTGSRDTMWPRAQRRGGVLAGSYPLSRHDAEFATRGFAVRLHLHKHDPQPARTGDSDCRGWPSSGQLISQWPTTLMGSSVNKVYAPWRNTSISAGSCSMCAWQSSRFENRPLQTLPIWLIAYQPRLMPRRSDSVSLTCLAVTFVMMTVPVFLGNAATLGHA